MSQRKFNLSGHKNPKQFFKELKKRYVDGNVKLSLEGQDLSAEISADVPLQLQINIFSFIADRVQEQMQ